MAKSKPRKAAARAAAAQAAARAAAQRAQNAAKAKAAKKSAPAATSPPAASAPVPGPPPQPARVDPFFTAEDLAAINDFVTNFSTKLTDIDYGVKALESDTAFQKGQNDTSAKANTNEAADVMAARGLFKSSVKDAAIYDIEAHRTLANKFLDDKLTETKLNAGTQKKILADSKRRFDEAMKAKQVQNAQGVNDNSLAAWADRMAAWVPPAAPASKAKPPGPAPKPVARPASAPVPAGKKLIGAASPSSRAGGLSNAVKLPKAPKPKKPAKPR